MIIVQTQEAGTGKWFSIVEYTPGTDAQEKRAQHVLEALDTVDLYARSFSTGEGNGRELPPHLGSIEQPHPVKDAIDWIETELAMEDGNFRDVDVILSEARTRFQV